ncbi:MAG: family 10 glycosylhydrolase [Saprospiraceae bacterium]|nr:family 10 glycosylhydrolase [Saprospiraceae bacterium]
MNHILLKKSPILLFIFLYSCSTINESHLVDSAALPAVPREFRAAWVATVANINWPSQPGLPVEDQKAEAIKLLDFLRDHHFNAVIFQVRPQCDALYSSELEPWSYYLTGAQGSPPEPEYDPLNFWIEEAHKRRLELHVWLNPYRAHHTAGGEITEHSIVRQRPELVVKLKNGMWWMDPSLKETQDHSYNVVMDIVQRYDIDGVHFDDYFYPYPSYNENLDFPDSASYMAYRASAGKLSRSDWRRESVNTFIKRLYKGIKKEKKHVKFGISPFGIWRPANPESIQGFDQYEQLYADAKLWLNKGWIDYFAPQLYWPTNQIPQSFPVLLNWWADENTKGRHLWPGINIGRLKGDQAIDEAINQIMISRAMLDQSPGVIHWSIGPLVKNDSLAEKIFSGPYRQEALVPAMDWRSPKRPGPPRVYLQQSGSFPVLHIDAKSEFKSVVIYYQNDSILEYKIIPIENSEIKISDLKSLIPDSRRILLAVVNRFGQMSPTVLVNLPE